MAILMSLIGIIIAISCWCAIYFHAESLLAEKKKKEEEEKLNSKKINKNKKKKIIVKDL